MNRIILALLITILCSCGQADESITVLEPKQSENTGSGAPVDSQLLQRAEVPDTSHVHTKYVYVNPSGHHLTIENSYPKGGMTYTDSEGGTHVYAVFWSRITNETDGPFELAMDFGVDTYDIASSPGRYFKLYFPTESMTPAKESLYNYGLDVEEYLDNAMHHKAEIKRTINPKSFATFYVVVLFNKWVDGTVRTGLRIEDGQFVYSVNDREIEGGLVQMNALKLLE